MKICHLCLNGPYNEGWNYQENILPKYHVKQGNKVYQLVTQYMWEGTSLIKCIDSEYINSNGVHVIRCKAKKGLVGGIRLNRYPELSQLLVAIEPDVIFIHDVQFVDAPVVAKYLKNHPECVAYADSHTDFSNSARNWVSKNILHKLLWKHMAHTLNPYIKKFYGVLPARVDFLVDVYGLPKEKCELLVMGADDELVEPAHIKRDETRKKYSIEENDFLVMTGGKIDLFKTQTLLLMEAVHKITRKNVKLIVFGSVAPELKDEVESLADGEKVQYIGWINANESYPLFAAADLVVFPGRHSVFWEQVVAQGIPMLVKHWNGTTHVDIGGNVGFLYEDSADEIKNAIESILLEENYNAMFLAARKKRINFYIALLQKKR